MGGFGIWEVLILLVIILLLFGATRWRRFAKNLGPAAKVFKNELVKEGTESDATSEQDLSKQGKPTQPSDTEAPEKEEGEQLKS